MSQFEANVRACLKETGAGEKPTLKRMYAAVSGAAMKLLPEGWNRPGAARKLACYFSAEYLTGRLVYSNLLNMGLLEEAERLLEEYGFAPSALEEVPDAALGNGGLGRLAACFLDSAATHDIPLDGFGIRYRYGLFKQHFKDGFQKETADEWLHYGDPWSVRREDEAVWVRFRDQTVKAVPYDMPVIGYGGGTVNTLRLWQAEAQNEFDFPRFNRFQYDGALREKNRAEEISAALYPNEDAPSGKMLRLKQQYFFSSASLQTLVRRYAAEHGEDFSGFADAYAIQLNDTHPVISIPELLRILMADYGLSHPEAFPIIQKTFAYTNHTILAEALEKWNLDYLYDVIPEVYPYIVLLNNALNRELMAGGLTEEEREPYRIVSGGQVHMARMAIYATHSTNGVAQVHSDLLKTDALKEWYLLYPDRFNNKTNGITQRRWLRLCNPELSGFITRRIGDGWVRDLDELEKLIPLADDPVAVEEFAAVKKRNKERLCGHIEKAEGVRLDPGFLFDVQIKRLHEYKRQFLNALSILDIYFGLKDGSIQDFHPTAFLFGAKAFPSYTRAKAILKLINEIARLVGGDPDVKDKIQVLFVQDYNVSYAEKLIPAADISEQISTAGKEASGTSNMKLMLNGAVTLGTMDGANIEIVEQAGEENNYIFGASVEEIGRLTKEKSYDPMALYRKSPRIRRVMDTLVDGTLKDGKTGLFRELYDSILEGASWHPADQYFLLLDFEDYCDAKLRAIRDYGRDPAAFARKCLLNTASAGRFSSDRTIREYAKEIWGL